MEAEALRAIVAENRQLEQNLTKRNEQYIFDLKKSLKAANLSEEELALALHGILPELVAGQKTGKTARQLFGTVSERTEAILNKPAEVKEPAGWMIWLDNTLLLLGLLTIMLAAMSLFSKGTAQPLGLTTYILGAMAGGYVFYLMHKSSRWRQKQTSWLVKNDRHSIWRNVLVDCSFRWFSDAATSNQSHFRSDDCFSNRCVSLCSTLFLQEKIQYSR